MNLEHVVMVLGVLFVSVVLFEASILWVDSRSIKHRRFKEIKNADYTKKSKMFCRKRGTLDDLI